jgi:putative transposase
MPKHAHTVEQIISKQQEAEVLISQGQTIPAAAKAIGITDQTYYRWRK